jgi:hypothetical protein
MKAPSRLFISTLVLSAGVVLFIAGHGIIVYYVLWHTAVSATVQLGVIILVVMEHLGLFGFPLRPFTPRRADAHEAGARAKIKVRFGEPHLHAAEN